jgi:hypothetical protein
MYRTEKEKRYLSKIYANVLARKTSFFRRPLAINHKPTDIKVIKLTKKDNYLEKIGGFSSHEKNVCFFIRHVNKFDTFLFNCKIDIVLTNINHQVIEVMSNVAPDNILHLPKKTHNI